MGGATGAAVTGAGARSGDDTRELTADVAALTLAENGTFVFGSGAGGAEKYCTVGCVGSGGRVYDTSTGAVGGCDDEREGSDEASKPVVLAPAPSR